VTLGFLSMCLCGIMGTELRETPSLYLYWFNWLADVISKWQGENLQMGNGISLPVLKWRLNTAMIVSLIQF